MLAAPREFVYPEPDGKPYVLWVAQTEATERVFVAEKLAAGGYRLIGELKASSFVGTPAAMHMTDLINKARSLHTASKYKPPPGTNPLPGLKTMQDAVTAAEDLVVADIRANACKAINAGCFAAGTKLWTRSGWRAVETIEPGEEVLSRSEHDPAGEPAWKVVEARFERTGCILHVHIGGEVIRTTPEHPFFVHGQGWKAAGSLSAGDRIATLSGEWVRVEEVFDTQEWAPVYNLRVADYHTYFVGDEGWAFAAWAHNAYLGTHAAVYAAISSNAQHAGHQAHHIGQDAAMDGLTGYIYSQAPAIELYAGTTVGGAVSGSAHNKATSTQRTENARLRRTGATTMTIQQQAEIAEKALRAAQAAPNQGPFGAITDAEITQAMAAFWQYVGSINATANTTIPIPG